MYPLLLSPIIQRVKSRDMEKRRSTNNGKHGSWVLSHNPVLEKDKVSPRLCRLLRFSAFFIDLISLYYFLYNMVPNNVPVCKRNKMYSLYTIQNMPDLLKT